MVDSLASFIHEIDGDSHLRVEYDYGDGYVRLNSSEAERRQAAQDITCVEDAVLELLRNARDAHAHTMCVAVSKQDDVRNITVIDDGDGIPEHMYEEVFKPRVTSKLDSFHADTWGVHGRGMALYSIKVNAPETHVALSEVGYGTSIAFTVDTSSLKERKDQSSLPVFKYNEANHVKVTGPRNIARVVCEFACTLPSDVGLYLGSPAEIAATLLSLAADRGTEEDWLFGEGANLPLMFRLPCATSPEDLAAWCVSLGITISARTARRVMQGEIPPVDSVGAFVAAQLVSSDARGHAEQKRSVKKPKDGVARSAQNFKPAQSDVEELQRSLREAYGTFASKYYLAADCEDAISFKNGRMTYSIPILSPEDLDGLDC